MTTSETHDELERPSDYGAHKAFWNAAENQTDVGVSLPPPPAPLTAEQVARRASLRRLVLGIVAGLGALTAVAVVVGFVRQGHGLSSATSSTAAPTLTDAKPLPAPPPVPLALPAEASPAPVASVSAAPSAFDWQAFASAPAPDAASLSDWTSASKGLSHAEFVRADKALARASNKGDVGHREAARLARAILWRENDYPRAAHRAFVQLAERAKTPLVREDARAALAMK